jgi:ParB-like chromosome segregation protein Spo0J
MPRYEVHDSCFIFPQMSAEELAGVKEDIKANGVQSAVVLWRDPEQGGKLVIVDGRHRSAICEELDIDYPTREFKGTPREMASHVCALNFHRRNMDPGQRAVAWLKMNDLMKVYEAAGRTGLPGRPTGLRSGDAEIQPTKPLKGPTVDAIAKEIGVSAGTVKRAERVKREAPEKLDEVMAGKKSINEAHAEVVTAANESNKIVAKDKTVDHEARMKAWNKLVEDWATEVTVTARNAPDGIDETTLGIIADQIKSAAGTIRAQKGHGICPYCNGKGCKKCNELGWLSKVKFESVPPTKKGAA